MLKDANSVRDLKVIDRLQELVESFDSVSEKHLRLHPKACLDNMKDASTTLKLCVIEIDEQDRKIDRFSTLMRIFVERDLKCQMAINSLTAIFEVLGDITKEVGEAGLEKATPEMVARVEQVITKQRQILEKIVMGKG